MVAVEPVGAEVGTERAMRAKGLFAVVNVCGGLLLSLTGIVQRMDIC